MSGAQRLVIFDVDGTLVDSQGDILAAMKVAFEAVSLPAPSRAEVLSIVGLSLPQAFARLAPDADHDRMIAAYKEGYIALRAQAGVAQSSPFYPGAREALARLQAQPDVLLGVATGKSKRGLDKLIEGHGLEGVFVTRQVSDFHPSKPHPSMILQAMAEAGVAARGTVMIGDTSFDLQMAASAGVAAVGVSWGYHPVADLAAHRPRTILQDFADLDAALDALWACTP
ncbi:HAD-IA family hydrolase [uncultured Roseobacter sp.]|uniref:HAD-IA family hydrolase n=1 Tax=uncultured Roseobacter sp. TaxID=114847 RepID=UPI0026216D16|nr:HAD-IA family hydrolase [uncultured Roseobacter sp.]